jgi:probable rRNA maturation factor
MMRYRVKWKRIKIKAHLVLLRNRNEIWGNAVIIVEVDEEYQDHVPGVRLEQAAQKTLQLSYTQELPTVSIKITGDKDIQALNASYRDIDKATDVLSFSADFFDPDLGAHYLGDIVISFPQAALQAVRRGHPVQSELQLLVVHGILHLLGYDHGSEEEKSEMWNLQDQVLTALGLNISIEDEE